tara:strand:+ start:588 stop:719 length:132 start_codon:yes stop_codon:yes gene_type:complete
MFEPATKSKTEEEQQEEIYWHIFWLIETKSMKVDMQRQYTKVL